MRAIALVAVNRFPKTANVNVYLITLLVQKGAWLRNFDRALMCAIYCSTPVKPPCQIFGSATVDAPPTSIPVIYVISYTYSLFLGTVLHTNYCAPTFRSDGQLCICM